MKTSNKKVKVWCEWDMGFSNINDYESVFDSMEEAIKVLEKVSWGIVGFNTYEEVVEAGLLFIEELEVKD